MKVKIIGGCYEYWYRDYYGSIFEVVREDDNAYWIRPIEGFEYPYKRHLIYSFSKDNELPVAKYDVSLLEE